MIRTAAVFWRRWVKPGTISVPFLRRFLHFPGIVRLIIKHLHENMPHQVLVHHASPSVPFLQSTPVKAQSRLRSTEDQASQTWSRLKFFLLDRSSLVPPLRLDRWVVVEQGRHAGCPHAARFEVAIVRIPVCEQTTLANSAPMGL